jgi:acetyl esterase/lipase
VQKLKKQGTRLRAGALLGIAAALISGCASTGLAVLNLAAPHVVREQKIAFAAGPRGAMDIYAPADTAGTPRPLIVFWYGGAWDSGSRNDYRFVGAALAARGAMVAVPDYRLYPEVVFPQFLHDAALAVAKAQREAGAHHADPRRTVLGGHSAGAYIAAMLALQPQYLREAGVDPTSIAGFFGLSGPYEINPDTDALRAIFNAQAEPAQFQPIAHASASAPPALLVHGGADKRVSPVHSEHLAATLQSLGVAVTLRVVPDRSHVDTLVALSRAGKFRIPDLVTTISEFAAGVSARPVLP